MRGVAKAFNLLGLSLRPMVPQKREINRYQCQEADQDSWEREPFYLSRKNPLGLRTLPICASKCA